MRHFCAIFFAFLLCGSVFAEEINLLDTARSWRSPNPGAKIELFPSRLTAVSALGSIGLINGRPLNFSTRDFDLLVITMKTDKDGIGEFSWASEKTGFSFRNSFPFYLRRAGRFHTYYINLAAYDRDGTRKTRLVLFPFSGSGSAEITELKLVKGSVYEKTLAGWQEFWGPAGREPDGMNFLITRGPRLFGGPILRYLNYILLTLLAVVVLLRKRLDLRRQFLILLVGLWLLLEFSSLVNNWIAFNRDSRYIGKNLKEKRAMVNTGDFYSFIKFADRELPPGASFEVVAAGYENVNRPAYYLYPRLRAGNAAYLLVYDSRVDPKLYNRYKPWKTFRKGAYIFKS